MQLFAVVTALLLAAQCNAGNVFFARSPKGRYKLSYAAAHKLCKEMGAHLATYEELKAQQEEEGYERCACGWVLNKKAVYPMNSTDPACGGRPGIHECYHSYTYDAYCYAGDTIGNCSTPLGMETGEIGNHQILSSSYYTTFIFGKWYATEGRLHNTGMINAWVPYVDNTNQYLEIDLLEAMAITGVVTQGANRFNKARYVKEYTIQFSKDGQRWKTFLDRDGEEEVFTANNDNDTPVRNMFWIPILAERIRIYPTKWHKHITLRAEILGCNMGVYNAAEAAARDIAISSNGEIPMPRPGTKNAKPSDTRLFIETSPPDDAFN